MDLSSVMAALPAGPDALALPAAVGALVTGLTGSPHCALMCGPLACVGLVGEPAARRRAGLAWQAGRAVAYVLVGAGLGLVGGSGARWLGGPVPRVLPWLMAVGLVASAFEGRWPERWRWRRARKEGDQPLVPSANLAPSQRVPGLRARISRFVVRTGESFSPISRAALRGAITPLLPCGLIYGAFLAALGAGSAVGGAMVMGGFALGTLPALALVQSQLPRLGARRPRLLPMVRRVVPLLAAAVVIWRALSVSPAGVPHCHEHAGQRSE